MLILIVIMENLFKMAVSYTLVLIIILIYKVPISWCVFNIIPLFITLIVFTFGCSCLMLHAGVYLSDLPNIVKVALRLVFYMSGIFFNIKRNVPKPYNTYLNQINPMAVLIDGFGDSCCTVK